MALLYESGLRSRVRKYAMDSGTRRSDSAVLEHVAKRENAGRHDIFLSHAYVDHDLILGAALVIEEFGFKVYIDWRDDTTLSRNAVTHKTARRLREQLKRSRCLLYCTTENANNSRWMPWELGYKDGHCGRVAVLPVAKDFRASDDYEGQEYLGIYPYVTSGKDTREKERLWINISETNYVSFDAWLEGKEPHERRK